MSSQATVAGQGKLSRAQWGVLVLLSLSLFINYIDRGNLSIAAPMLKNELHLSPSQLGGLLSAFFWTYAFCLPLSGWLVDRFNVNWIFAGGFLLWSVATTITGAVHGFVALLIVRLILGMGESTAYPSYSRILCRQFSENRRGTANAAVAAGKSFGPALGVFTGGLLMARYGWRPFFVVLGAISLIWLGPWLKWAPKEPAEPAAAKPPSPSVAEVLQHRSAWGTCAGLFGLNYLSYFMITWLPYYLVQARHFSMDKMASTLGFAYLCQAIVALLTGWFSDWWITAGATPSRARKTVMVIGQLGTGFFLAVCVIAPAGGVGILLCLAAMSFGMCDSNIWAITQTLAGPYASGKWTGVQNFLGNLAGIVAPAAAGILVDKTGSFFWAFATTGAIAALGALTWVFMVGPLQQVDWNRPDYDVAAWMAKVRKQVAQRRAGRTVPE